MQDPVIKKNSERIGVSSRKERGRKKVRTSFFFFLEVTSTTEKKGPNFFRLTVRRVVVLARLARLLDALAAIPARVLVHPDALSNFFE